MDGVRCVRAHRVLLDSVRTGTPDGQRAVLGTAAALMLELALPERGDHPSPEAVGQLQMLSPHASRLLETAPGERTARLAVRVVRQVYEALVSACERVLPPDHLTTLMARHMRAYGLCALERFQEAEPVARRMPADRIRLQGADHYQTLSARYLMARIAHGLGRRDEAVAALEQVVEKRERVFGAGHPGVVVGRERLAQWRAEPPTR